MDDKRSYNTYEDYHLTESDKINQINLRQAIRLRNEDLVKHLLGRGVEVNGYHVNDRYHRPLHLAVISRSPNIVKLLLQKGANISLKTRNGETPLMLAAKTENIHIIDLLLTHTMDNDEEAYSGLSHFHIACMRNNMSVVRQLLLKNQVCINKSVKRNSTCWAGFTPLHFAVQYGCVEIVRFLLRCGADITVKDVRQMSPLHLADFHRNEEIIDLILAKHKNEFRNPTDAQGLSHFHIACTRDDASVVKHFLRSGVDVNLAVDSSPWEQWRPIHFATYYECPSVIELLMKNKINLEVSHFTQLLKLSRRMGSELINDLFSMRRYILGKTCDEYEGITELHQACIQNGTKKIETMLSLRKVNAPSDFDVPIWTGSTPVHLAVKCRSEDTVKLLLKHGADFMVQDVEGKTPLHIAFEDGQTKLVNSIVKTLECQDRNLTDNTGLSIFHILCSTDALGTIESFVQQGIDINAQVGNGSSCWAGLTPLHFATMFRKPKVVALLVKHNADVSIRNVLGMSSLDFLMDGFTRDSNQDSAERDISEILMIIFSSLPKDFQNSDFKAMTPLHALCINRNTDLNVLQEYLIQHQDEINKTTDLPTSLNFHKCTALHLAMQRHSFDQAMLLLGRGADPLVMNGKGETPFECAESTFGYGHFEMGIKDLFSLKTFTNNLKPSHFHLACMLGFTEVVKDALDSMDETLRLQFVNCVSDGQRTPLHASILENDEVSAKQITHLLLENGADVNARNHRLHTPLHCAVFRSGNVDIACTLISYGADVNAQDLYGQTPLHLVELEYSGEELIMLLENGADINIFNERGRTCLMEMYQNLGNRDRSRDSRIIMLKHVSKLKVVGFHIHDENLKIYAKLLRKFRTSFDERAFTEKCSKELESMMNVTIDSRTTLHDILFKSSNKMIFHCNNTVLETIVNSSGFFEKFPIYGPIIRLRLKDSKVRGPLLSKSQKRFIFLSRKSLPPLCMETIFQYLSNLDLKNVITSAKEIRSQLNH